MTPELSQYISRREEVLNRVRTLLVERLHVERDPDSIDPDTPLFGTGLGLDSVDAVEMVVSLEDTFGLKLPDDALGRRVMRTVGKLVDLVLAYEKAAAGEGNTNVPLVLEVGS
ncbi:MAG: acyl carrier protein [Polyangiaceae bacterium]|nr:acyl carrier protein [Polyangiaceae bacterium]